MTNVLTRNMKKQMNEALQRIGGDVFFCWLGRTISHDELERLCYPTHGKVLGSQNQH
jgi:hypothetical protein